MDGDYLLSTGPRSTMTSPGWFSLHLSNFYLFPVQEVVEFIKLEINGEAVDVAIPLPEDVESDEYVAQLFADAKLDICLLDGGYSHYPFRFFNFRG